MSKNKVILYFSSIIIVIIFIIIINPYLTTKKNNSKDSSTIIMTNYSGYSSKTFETWTALNSFDSSRKELHLNALFPNSVWTFETDRRNNSWDLRQSLSKPFLLRFDWLELFSLRLCTEWVSWFFYLEAAEAQEGGPMAMNLQSLQPSKT